MTEVTSRFAQDTSSEVMQRAVRFNLVLLITTTEVKAAPLRAISGKDFTKLFFLRV